MSERVDTSQPRTAGATRTAQPPARWRTMLWPGVIIAVLLASAGSNIAMMFVANSDPSFAVEPDYYRKAVTWDARMSEVQSSLQLGWTAEGTLSLDAAGDSGTITIDVRDREGSAVSGAGVHLIALFNARAAERFPLVAVEQSPGCYVARLPARYAGEWEVRVAAIRQSDEFHAILRTTAAIGSSDVCATIVSPA